MLGILSPVTTPPNRVQTSEKEKDEEYHRQFARWCVYDAHSSSYIDHQNRIKVNKSFYSPNGQWMEREDLEAFFMDRSGQTNNRIRVEMNMIQVMGNQYVGNSNRMSITCRARSVSPLSQSRRMEQLAKSLVWTDIAKRANPMLQEKLRSEMPIGVDEKETTKIFNSIYKDKYVKAVNTLLSYSELVNRFEDSKKELAEDLMLSGMCIMKPMFYNGEYLFRQVYSDRFFWDASAKKYDLSDAMYMGEWELAIPVELYESCPNITQDQIEAIERYVSSHSRGMYSHNGKVVVYNAYWRDCVRDEYGYVKDENGNIFFTRINSAPDWQEKPKYTDSDVVNVSELNKEQKRIIGKERANGSAKAKTIKYCDQWRYCRFIPSEIVGGYYQQYQDKIPDIILDYGVDHFQENEVFRGDNMRPPFKVNQYLYVDGNTYSPIDIAINPQRMVNRIYSVIENMMNNSRGSGTAYDPDMVEDIPQFLADMHQSKPVAIRTKGMGINNVISRYDNTVGNGAVVLKQFADSFITAIESITGVTNAMKGQIDSPDQLVGVYQLMIRRGSITQERFYDALEKVYKDCYQAVATAGRRYYCMNRKKLIDYVGDDNTNVIEMSVDMANEEMLVDVKRSLSPDDERKYVDSTVTQMMQIGMIDKYRFANIIGRGTEDDMWIAIREYARESEQAERIMAEQMKKQEAAGMMMGAQQQQQQSDMQLTQMKNQNEQKSLDRQHDVDKLVIEKALSNGQGERQLG